MKSANRYHVGLQEAPHHSLIYIPFEAQGHPDTLPTP